MEIFILQTVEQGLIYSIVALSVYLSYRILDYADLSVDGTLPLGAAVAATLIVKGYHPWLATLIALVAGALAGLGTGFLHTRFKINPLLTGILTMTGLYSINLQIMGKSNLPLLNADSIFKPFLGLNLTVSSVLLLLVIISIIVIVMNRFFETEIGLALRATGNNPHMITCLGVNTDYIKLLGLGIANAMVSLSGALLAQNMGFADVGLGIGTITGGLASLIIGEMLFSNGKILNDLIAVVLGSLLFRFIIAIALKLGLDPAYLKLMTALLVIIALASPTIKQELNQKKERKSYA